MENTPFQRAVNEFIEKRIDDSFSVLKNSKIKLVLEEMESELQKVVACEKNRETLRKTILQVVDQHTQQAYKLGWADSKQLFESCSTKK